MKEKTKFIILAVLVVLFLANVIYTKYLMSSIGDKMCEIDDIVGKVKKAKEINDSASIESLIEESKTKIDELKFSVYAVAGLNYAFRTINPAHPYPCSFYSEFLYSSKKSCMFYMSEEQAECSVFSREIPYKPLTISIVLINIFVLFASGYIILSIGDFIFSIISKKLK